EKAAMDVNDTDYIHNHNILSDPMICENSFPSLDGSLTNSINLNSTSNILDNDPLMLKMNTKDSSIIHTTVDSIDNIQALKANDLNSNNIDSMQVNSNLVDLNTNAIGNEDDIHSTNYNFKCNKKYKTLTPSNTIDIAEFDRLSNNNGCNSNENISARDTPQLDAEKLISQINNLSSKIVENITITNKDLEMHSQCAKTLVDDKQCSDGICDKDNKEKLCKDKINMNKLEDSIHYNTPIESKHETKQIPHVLKEEENSSVNDEASIVANANDLLSNDIKCLDDVNKSTPTNNTDDSSLENPVDKPCINDITTKILDEGNTKTDRVNDFVLPIESDKINEADITVSNKDTDLCHAPDLDQSCINDTATKNLDVMESIQNEGNTNESKGSDILDQSDITKNDEEMTAIHKKDTEVDISPTLDKSSITENETKNLEITESIQSEGNTNNDKVGNVLISNDNNKINEEVAALDKNDTEDDNSRTLDKSSITENETKNLEMTETIQNVENNSVDKPCITDISTKNWDEVNTNKDTVSDILPPSDRSKINEENVAVIKKDKDFGDAPDLDKHCIADMGMNNLDMSDTIQNEGSTNDIKVSDISKMNEEITAIDKKDTEFDNAANLDKSSINENTKKTLDIAESTQDEGNSNTVNKSDTLLKSDSNKIKDDIAINKEHSSITDEITNTHDRSSDEIKCTDEIIEANTFNKTVDSPLEKSIDKPNIDDFPSKPIDNSGSMHTEINSDKGKVSDDMLSEDSNNINEEIITIEENENDTELQKENSNHKCEVDQEIPPLDLKFAEQIISAGAVFENIVTSTENSVEKNNTSGNDINDLEDKSILFNLKSEEQGEKEKIASVAATEKDITSLEKLHDTSLTNLSSKPCDTEISSKYEESIPTTTADNVYPVNNNLVIDCSEDEGIGSEYSKTEYSACGNEGIMSSCNEVASDVLENVTVLKEDLSTKYPTGNDSIPSSCNEEKSDALENVTELKEDLSTKYPCYDRQLSDDDICSTKEVKLKRLDTMDYISDDEDSKSSNSEDEKEVIVHKKKSKRSKKRKVYRAMDSSLSRLDTVDEHSHISLFEKKDNKGVCNSINEAEETPCTPNNDVKKDASTITSVPLDFTPNTYIQNIPIVPKNTLVPEVHNSKESKNEHAGLNIFGVITSDVNQKKVDELPTNIYVNDLFDANNHIQSPTLENTNDVMEDICLKASDGSKENNIFEKTDEDNAKQKNQVTLDVETKVEDLANRNTLNTQSSVQSCSEATLEETKENSYYINAELSADGSEAQSNTGEDEGDASEETTQNDIPEATAIVSYGFTGFMYDMVFGMFGGMKRLALLLNDPRLSMEW
ncbi:unnamed protein product, partial [Meganyctiphanes norvegica]